MLKEFYKKHEKPIKTALGCAGIAGSMLLGYKIGFDKVYKTYVPGSYRVNGLSRYIGKVKELDISAFEIKIIPAPVFH